jgi:Protein of unknown function (DUF421)
MSASAEWKPNATRVNALILVPATSASSPQGRNRQRLAVCPVGHHTTHSVSVIDGTGLARTLSATMGEIERVFLGDWHMNLLRVCEGAGAVHHGGRRVRFHAASQAGRVHALGRGDGRRDRLDRGPHRSRAGCVADHRCRRAVPRLIVAHSALARLRFVPRLRRLVDPPLRVLIRDGKVDRRNLRRCGLTDADLNEALRQHGQLGPERVRLAVFEEKGSVCVLTD